MSKRRERQSDDIFRRRVRQMVTAGYADSRIAKETGKSITHVRLVAAQERAELTNENGTAPLAAGAVSYARDNQRE